MMLKRALFKVGALTIAAFVLLIVADKILFTFGTFDGTNILPSVVTEHDIRWWNRLVGSTTLSTDIEIEPPVGLTGHDGTWYHGRGGAGANGLNGHALRVTKGLVAYKIIGNWPIIQGRAMASVDTWAYRVGTTLPLVMLERHIVTGRETDFPHPNYEPWKTVIRWPAALANTALLTLLLGWPMMLRDAIAIWRARHGRCFKCGHILMPTQSTCPECGRARRFA